jgi:hypothetical protein
MVQVGRGEWGVVFFFDPKSCQNAKNKFGTTALAQPVLFFNLKKKTKEKGFPNWVHKIQSTWSCRCPNMSRRIKASFCTCHKQFEKPKKSN